MINKGNVFTQAHSRYHYCMGDKGSKTLLCETVLICYFENRHLSSYRPIIFFEYFGYYARAIVSPQNITVYSSRGQKCDMDSSDKCTLSLLPVQSKTNNLQCTESSMTCDQFIRVTKQQYMCAEYLRNLWSGSRPSTDLCSQLYSTSWIEANIVSTSHWACINCSLQTLNKSHSRLTLPVSHFLL